MKYSISVPKSFYESPFWEYSYEKKSKTKSTLIVWFLYDYRHNLLKTSHNYSHSIRTIMEGFPYNVVYSFMLYRFRSILIFQKLSSFWHHIISMQQRAVFDAIESFTQQKRTENPRLKSSPQQFSESIVFAYVISNIERCCNIKHLNRLHNIKL